ncbi:major facilitator superfamily domain-containing protein [Dipodascopsis tothii]|uniref:major facilitator superfamily domain-containing protein n=1 Tax=Dipodascopsis tothii TaxID=44089 RepID=UPI0034CE9F46
MAATYATDEKAGEYKENFEELEYVRTGAHVDYAGVSEKTDPVEIRLVRKLDMIILPMLWLLLFCNYMDRNAVTNAKLGSLTADLKLKGSEYNTSISILFVGYILGQIPSNMALTRVRPSIYIASFSMIWSTVSALTALVHDYTGLVLCRFFLGVVEAPFYPGALYILAMFYTKKELALRVAVFYTGNIAANAFCGLIAAAVFATLEGSCGLAGWRWLFIITGAASFGCGIIALFVLPNTPKTTWWLSESERELAWSRIKRDTTEDSGDASLLHGLQESLCDYHTWLFGLLINVHVSGDSFKNFFPTVIETLKFNRTITLVLTCPPYVISCFFSSLLCWSSGRKNERTWHITVATAVVIGGFILCAATTSIAPRYVGMVIFVSFSSGVNDIILSWAASTMAQTPEKKAISLSVINTIAQIGNIYTPYLWPSSSAPRYTLGMSACAGYSIIVIATTWLIRHSLMRENKKIRQTAPETVVLFAY